MTLTAKLKLIALGIVVLAAVAGIAVFYRVFQGNTSPVRVACVGDSITGITGYPADLQTLLGNSYEVRNFGVMGATILLNTDRPYINQTAFLEVKQFQPQVVVILLGTNDARTNIYQYSQNLEADYKRLIDAFQAFASKPEVLIAIPPPIFNNTLGLSSAYLDQGVIPRVEQVAKELHLPTIDIYGALVIRPELFPDGVHPNNEGAQIIANEVYKALIPRYTRPEVF